MREVLLLKYGEIALKGLNLPTFEAILISNLKRRLNGLGRTVITKAQSTINIEPQDDNYDIDEAISRIQKVFGIAAISRALVIEKDLEKIKVTAASYLRESLENAASFKVSAKRSDKKFAYGSPEICAEVGEYLLDAYPNLHVDVHEPEVNVIVEIRDFGAYIHGCPVPGAGGMPVGSSGRAAVLISGGIDSPVAAYMLAKRGVRIEAVHFASPPYTSERAKLKVMELLKIVSQYSGRIVCHVVPFTKIQEQIQKNCPEELFTIIMRRFMMKIAAEIVSKNACSALITGESIGQVASQTIEAISCTDKASTLPVFRPLIGMDKEEIVQISRKIGTFETSIQPYEDCCTVFTPRHPRTRPKIEFVLEAESKFDFEPLLKEAIEGAERIVID